MAYKEIFWMACDSTEQLRAEYGPFRTRIEAENEAKKLGFGYLLRYEHMLAAIEGLSDQIELARRESTALWARSQAELRRAEAEQRETDDRRG